MASYRYERDIDPKDLKPRKQRQYSRRERWANWWDYNLKWVLIFGIAGAFVAYCFIGQYFLTTHPDYNVAVVSPYYLPDRHRPARAACRLWRGLQRRRQGGGEDQPIHHGLQQ